MKNAHMTKEELTHYRQSVNELLLLPSTKKSIEVKHTEARKELALIQNWITNLEREFVKQDALWLSDALSDTCLKEVKEEFSKWDRLLRRTSLNLSGQFDIEKAKSVPILSIHSFEALRQEFGTVAHAVCPFHSERSASFAIYNKQNTAHCFGCGWHGDVIDFIRKRDGLTFPQAVKSLTS